MAKITFHKDFSVAREFRASVQIIRAREYIARAGA
jgi:hypothetical protein